MKRIDRYWKRMAIGLMFALTLMIGDEVFESFAMPQEPTAASQSLTSPGKIIVEDETKKQETAADPNVPAVLSTAQTAAFGSVTTPVTDSTSLFGAGRLTMLANHDTNAQNLSVIIENGAGGLIIVDGVWNKP